MLVFLVPFCDPGIHVRGWIDSLGNGISLPRIGIAWPVAEQASLPKGQPAYLSPGWTFCRSMVHSLLGLSAEMPMKGTIGTGSGGFCHVDTCPSPTRQIIQALKQPPAGDEIWSSLCGLDLHRCSKGGRLQHSPRASPRERPSKSAH